MGDISIYGKLVNKTASGKIADWSQIDNINLQWDAINGKPDLSDIIATTGNKIVTEHTLAVDEVLTFEANTLYIIQCYDSSYNLQKFTTAGAKSIEGQTGFIVVGEVTANDTDSLVILADKGTLSTTAATTTMAKTAVPSSGNYLRYYKVQGTVPEPKVETREVYLHSIYLQGVSRSDTSAGFTRQYNLTFQMLIPTSSVSASDLFSEWFNGQIIAASGYFIDTEQFEGLPEGHVEAVMLPKKGERNGKLLVTGPSWGERGFAWIEIDNFFVLEKDSNGNTIVSNTGGSFGAQKYSDNNRIIKLLAGEY